VHKRSIRRVMIQIGLGTSDTSSVEYPPSGADRVIPNLRFQVNLIHPQFSEGVEMIEIKRDERRRRGINP